MGLQVLRLHHARTLGGGAVLTHGLGQPVKDATTNAEFPATGTYRVWVRTKDWVAHWKAPGAPGKFQVLIGGTPLADTFGTKGAEWGWHDGGTVNITNKRTPLALYRIHSASSQDALENIAELCH